MNPEESEVTNAAKRKLEETSCDNNAKNNRKKKRFMWNNKCVTEAVYNLRLKQQQNFRIRKKSTSEDLPPESKAASKKQKMVFGRRIIDVDLWAQNDRCKKCGQILSLANIIEENRHGLASLLIIHCQECLLENSITTDKTFTAPDGKTMYDVNARIALGLIDAGMDWRHLNKLLGVLDMPPFNNHLL
ncbi:uncharacterized protein LOC112494632 [Cephus cinctus]|uniref:Uncharacterized protein LOC112494632 n=1 Tax=Cephus cinctus TaxID=211228 RepID=A0AAJ7RKP2_CEPCN|nr:uncharacterized protein LOC112494632 [Cephus cinctus]